MKVEVIEEKKVVRLPEVGELWKHTAYSDVYLRIGDCQGRLAIGDNEDSAYFYSVRVNEGLVCRTSIKSTDIIILEPVGGVLKLQRKVGAE